VRDEATACRCETRTRETPSPHAPDLFRKLAYSALGIVDVFLGGHAGAAPDPETVEANDAT
jgi:hypothetical protein